MDIQALHTVRCGNLAYASNDNTRMTLREVARPQPAHVHSIMQTTLNNVDFAQSYSCDAQVTSLATIQRQVIFAMQRASAQPSACAVLHLHAMTGVAM